MEILKDFVFNVSKLFRFVLYSRPKNNTDDLYKKIVEFHKKFWQVVDTKDWDEEKIVFARKHAKKWNLTFKCDKNGPLNLDGDQTVLQTNILKYMICPGMADGDIAKMINFINKYPLNIIDGIPVEYVMAMGPYQNIIWKQLQLIFIITQLLISIPSSKDPVDKATMKKDIADEFLKRHEELKASIEADDLYKDISKKIDEDKKFKKKISPPQFNAEKIKAAKDEVMSKFSEKGIRSNDPIFKMVDSITGKLDRIQDADPGNIVGDIMSIAQEVSEDFKSGANQDEYKNTVEAVKGIFTEAINDPVARDKVPDNFKNIANVFFTSQGESSNQSNVIMENVERIVVQNGLNRDEFYKMITNNNGELDFPKLNAYLTQLNIDPTEIFRPIENKEASKPEKEVYEMLEDFVKANNLNREEFYKNIVNSKGYLDPSLLDEYMKKMSIK